MLNMFDMDNSQRREVEELVHEATKMPFVTGQEVGIGTRCDFGWRDLRHYRLTHLGRTRLLMIEV
jgi:hypothetical protein